MKKKKNSAMKKLIPATSMLLVSATMLTASTYAWFTMSREVEVTGIKLTATVPEDIQISLGHNTGISGTALETSGLSTASGSEDFFNVEYDNIVFPDGAGAKAENTNTTDWYNTVDFSQHYVAGKIKPVSSTDGNYLFKTSDATIKGKDVSRTAGFTALTEDDEADLYVLNGYASDSGKRTSGGSDLDFTQVQNLKDGYYIDFPVWFRTSAKSDLNGTSGYVTTDSDSYLNLGVIANITQRTATDANEDLYHAVRVAVIPTTGSDNTSAGMVNTGSTGVVANFADYVAGTGTNPSVKRYYDRYYNGTTYTANHGAVAVKSDDMSAFETLANQAVYCNGNLVWNPSTATVTNAVSLYGGVDYVKQPTTQNTTVNSLYTDGESVVKIPLAKDNKAYGYSARYVVRVWLEGEDINCWNETAGQDWDIALKFVELSNVADTGSYTPGDAHAGTDTTGTVSAANSVTASKNMTSGAPAAPANETVTVTFAGTGTTSLTTSYTWNSAENTYELTSGQKGWKHVDMKWTTTSPDATYTVDSTTWRLADTTTFANESDFISYLNSHKSVYALTSITLSHS